MKRKRKHFEKDALKGKENSQNVQDICCVVVSLRKRRLRNKRNPQHACLLTGKTTNKARAADLRFVYLNTLYRLLYGSRRKLRSRREQNNKGKTYFDIAIAVIMAERIHLFPFRTQKLSFLTPKVLSGTPLGRIGHRRFSVFRSL